MNQVGPRCHLRELEMWSWEGQALATRKGVTKCWELRAVGELQERFSEMAL